LIISCLTVSSSDDKVFQAKSLSITVSLASDFASDSALFVSKNAFFSSSVIDSSAVFSSSVNLSHKNHPQKPQPNHSQPLPSHLSQPCHLHSPLCGIEDFSSSSLVCSSDVKVSPFLILSISVLNSVNCAFCSVVNSGLSLNILPVKEFVVHVFVEAKVAPVAAKVKNNTLAANIFLFSIIL
jgi:hypothetical protein